MSGIDPNSPAFPSHGTMGEVVHTGMTIRAEIAARICAQVLGGYATGGNVEDCNYKMLAAESVRAADALIAELNKEPT